MMESKQGWAGRLTGRSGGKIEWGCHRREGGPSRKRGNFIGSDDAKKIIKTRCQKMYIHYRDMKLLVSIIVLFSLQ